MKKYIGFMVVLLVLTVVGFMVFQSQDDSNAQGSIRLFVFNTIVDITINDHYNDDMTEDITNLLTTLEQKYSRYIKGSEIDKINHTFGEPVTLSEELVEVLSFASEIHSASEGKFDVTMGPIVDLWQIGSPEERVPQADEVDLALAKVGFEKIDFNGKTLKMDQGMSLDLGGILKGYAADQIAAYLVEQHVNNAVVNLGGNLYLMGDHEADGWRIGIRNPFEGRTDYLGVVTVTDQSVVTSGPYEKYFIENEKRYHHIFDSATGYPVENTVESVTIISDQSIVGDAMTTAAFALGLEKGLALVNKMSNVEAIFVTKDKMVYVTDGLKDIYEHTDVNFRLY